MTASKKEMWDGFGTTYTALIGPHIAPIMRVLTSNASLDTANVVLETGGGAGLDLADTISRMRRGSKYHITDFSTTMVRLCGETVASLGNSSGVDVTVAQADATNLAAFADASVDRYVSCLCLHLVDDHDAALREARRVLRADGGIAAFAIWGRQENSGFFAIGQMVKDAQSVAGDSLCIDSNPGFQFSADTAQLRERVKRAGFTDVVMWSEMAVMELWDAERFVQFENTLWQKGEASDEWLASMRQKTTEWLASGRPIGLECYIIIAKC